MATLTPKQRAHLKRLAHHLKPVAHIGKPGVTDPVLRSIREAFNTRELLKIKALDTAPSPVRELADGIAASLEGVHAVHTVGRTAILYRRHPEHPQIELPVSGTR